MNLQNGYRVIYEKTADGKRTFYATKNIACDPTVDDKLVETTIGTYKLIYEKDGRFYGSETGFPGENDYCFTEFDKVFKETVEEPAAQGYSRRARRTTPVVEDTVTEPTVEVPAEAETENIEE